jgi:Ca2+-transporting ATPase
MQGVLVLLAVGALFVGLLRMDASDAEARAAAFTALVACAVALIIANRSFSGSLLDVLRRPNAALWRMLLAIGALLAAVLWIAPLRELFQFAPLPPLLLASAAGLGAGVLLVLELLKPLRRRVMAAPRA